MSQDPPILPPKPLGLSFLARAKQVSLGIVLAAALALLAAPARHVPLLAQAIGPASTQPAAGVYITMNPIPQINFNPAITDYVFTYNGKATLVLINAPLNTTVSVDGQPFKRFTFTTYVNVTPGQSFSIVVNSPVGSATYYYRCLPTDFPVYKTERPGTPQPEYFLFAPNLNYSAAGGHYVILADGYGVPIWWYKADGVPVDATLLADGNVAWTDLPFSNHPNGGAEERQLDGTLVHTFAPDSTLGGSLDDHELLLLPNGNYVYIVNINKSNVDLSPFGGSATATVIDNVIEEFDPTGVLVWHWSSLEHMPVPQTDQVWWQQYLVNATPADPFHMNAIEPDGDGYIVSFRHLNALLRINRASGNITWKLGGTQQPQSLTFVGDAYSNFGGQHDVRLLPDGTLTLHDNGSGQNRAPRAARYTLDTVAHTATFVEQVTDADVPSSGCCGGARKVAGGDWVMSWGQNPYITELAPDGSRVFRITVQGQSSAYHAFSYRVAPVPFGVLDRAAVRSGMNAQFPR